MEESQLEKNGHIVMFSHNRRDTAFTRRVSSLQLHCESLTTFSFRRDGEPEFPGPEWDNVDLGYAEHAKLFQRIFLYVAALFRVHKHRTVLREASAIHARNLDIFIFAWIACILCGCRTRMVYECLDVHEAMTKENSLASVLRWLERRILHRSSLLIVSSPGFIKNYFEPIQKYRGSVYLAENKLFFGSEQLPRSSTVDKASTTTEQITIAWVGIIRCPETLDLLKSAAEAMPDTLRIKIVGLVSYFLIPDFDAQIAALKNIEFAGKYEWPMGLAAAYSGADFVWAQELTWRGHNSDWLIPNRVYEGSYFGIPSIAVAGTETAAFVRQREVGYVIDDATPERLVSFLHSISRTAVDALKANLLQRGASAFVANDADAREFLAAIVGSP